MTQSTKYTKAIWTPPRKLKDNTIITANNWNILLSNIGSAAYVQEVSDYRSKCNVFVAEWDMTIPVKSSASASDTTITFKSVSGGEYFNKNQGLIMKLPDNTPFLLLWRIYFVEPGYTGYNFRTTLIKTAKVNKANVETVVAAHYLRKYADSQTYFDASYGAVSNFDTDKYRIRVAHGYHTALRCIGHAHLILNPGMV